MLALPILLSLLVPSAAPPLEGAHRVLILGDSITAAGKYTAYLEAYFAAKYPGREIEFINLGLPSETITGLTEPGHPFPRPNVHERLDRALTKLKPDVVLACYGMNDGIYQPFSAERLGKYQDGILKLVSRCRDDGIPVYLVTPPPFDPEPVRAKLQPLAEGKTYGWLGPYADYEKDVLARYAAWIMTFRGVNFTPIDAHTPILDHLTNARQTEGKGYGLSGDGVHMDATGHWFLADRILRAWNAPGVVDVATIDAKKLTASEGDVPNIRAEQGGIRFSWTTGIPLFHDPEWNHSRAFAFERMKTPINHHVLRVRKLEGDRFTLYEGDRKIGSIPFNALDGGIELQNYPELTTNRHAAEMNTLIRRRERLMSPAWLDFVGHKRPDTGKGLPLDEARKKAEPLTAEIKKLASPVTMELRIVPE